MSPSETCDLTEKLSQLKPQIYTKHTKTHANTHTEKSHTLLCVQIVLDSKTPQVRTKQSCVTRCFLHNDHLYFLLCPGFKNNFCNNQAVLTFLVHFPESVFAVSETYYLPTRRSAPLKENIKISLIP